MGKRRNKKQGNRQNTVNKAIERTRPEEENSIEKPDAEGAEQKTFDMEAAEHLTETPYTDESDDRSEAPYVEEAPYAYPEEADGKLETPYEEELYVQNDETYTENTDMEQEFSDVPIDSLLEEVNMSEKEKKDSFDRQHLEATNDFADFTRDFFKQIAKWIKRNRRMAMISVAVCAGVVVVIWIAVSVSHSIDEARLAASISGNMQSDLTVNTGVIPVPHDALQENAYPAVNELVVSYFEAIQNCDIETLRTLKNYVDDVEIAKVNAKYEYVESYSNINCYTKIGPIPNSYIVYVCYDVKFRDWDIIAPSLLTLFVCTNSEGNLYIYVGDFDDNVANYMAAISSQEDTYDLLQRVQTEYKEIMDENPDFAAHISNLIDTIKDEVGEQIADVRSQNQESDIPAGAETGPEEVAEVSENNAAQGEPENFEVRALTTVNVRASDSEVADRLGKVETGTVLLCEEQQVNGWSRVIYEDQIGYIKTEYLQSVGEGVDENTATGTITVSETVNVRRTANIQGEQMGVAYAGESFPLIGGTDEEWTQIIYNGQTGYIKSEFILEQ